MIDNWLWVIIENMQSLFDGVLIIIRATTGLASMQESSHELLFFTVEVQYGF